MRVWVEDTPIACSGYYFKVCRARQHAAAARGLQIRMSPTTTHSDAPAVA
jgi:hypothetical protein